MNNTFGRSAALTIFGESHGVSIGAVLDGLPAGEAIDWDAVRTEMARRAPGRNAMSTARSEADAFEVQSGFFNGYTTGTPLCAVIRNGDHRSRTTTSCAISCGPVMPITAAKSATADITISAAEGIFPAA